MTFVRRDRSATWLRVGIAALLLFGIGALLDVDVVLSLAAGASSVWIATALVLLPINLWLEAAKWRVLLRQSGVEHRQCQALGSVMAGYAVGLITPARVGDYFGRILYLPDARKGRLLVLAGLDRLYSIWVYALAGTVVLGFQLGGSLPGPAGIWWLTFVLGLLVSAFLGVVVFKPSSLHTISGALLRWPLTRRLRRHFDVVRELSVGTSSAVLFLTGARYVVFCTQFVCLLLAFTTAGSIETLYLGIVLVFFVKTLVPSVSLFDLGVRESAAVFFLGLYGVSAEVAFSSSLLLFAVNIVLPALVGIPFVLRIRWPRFGAVARQSQRAEIRGG